MRLADYERVWYVAIKINTNVDISKDLVNTVEGERRVNKIKQASALQLTALIRKQQTGFSLVELAVVIVIIGLLATMGLSALNVQQANGAISATKKNQETIKDSLIGYLGKNKHLPCPATDELGGSDIAARNSGTSPPNCKTNWGIVPYAELGLPRSVALDGWDNFYSYAVSPQWTASLNTSGINVGNTTNNPANAFNSGNIGTIQVKTRVPANQNPPTNVGTAVVALISYGINGFGAYTIKGTQQSAPPPNTDEASNSLVPSSLPLAALNLASLFQREFTDKDAGYGAFDDVVLWLSPNDLLTPLIKDGSMKSPEAQWVQQIADIQNYIVPQLITNALKTPPVCTANIVLPSRYKYDAWGNSILISPQTFSASASSMYTLTITSPNPSLPTLDAPSSSSLFPFLQPNCP